MMRSFSPWTWVIIISAGAAGLPILIGSDTHVRVVLALWFLLVCPGMMLVRFFRLSDPVLEWMLAIVLSLVADTFVGGILLYSSRWSPSGAFAILVALTIGGMLAQELSAMRAQRGRLG